MFENSMANYNDLGDKVFEWRIRPLGWEKYLASTSFASDREGAAKELSRVEELMNEGLLEAIIERTSKGYFRVLIAHEGPKILEIVASTPHPLRKRKNCYQMLKKIDPKGLIKRMG